MKRIFNFDQSAALPLVLGTVKGKLRKRPARLIFDTGAFITQFTTSLVEELGYSARDGIEPIIASGPSGPMEEGYTLKISLLMFLGKQFADLLVAVYDFDNLEKAGIDGLLGFDVIKQLHLEMNGPKSELIVFD